MFDILKVYKLYGAEFLKKGLIFMAEENKKIIDEILDDEEIPKNEPDEDGYYPGEREYEDYLNQEYIKEHIPEQQQNPSLQEPLPYQRVVNIGENSIDDEDTMLGEEQSATDAVDKQAKKFQKGILDNFEGSYSPATSTPSQDDLNAARLANTIEKAEQELNFQLRQKKEQLRRVKNQLKREPFFIRLTQGLLSVFKAPFRFIQRLLGNENQIQYSDYEIKRMELKSQRDQIKNELYDLKKQQYEINEKMNFLGDAGYEVIAQKPNEKTEVQTEQIEGSEKTNTEETITEQKRPINVKDKFTMLLKDIIPEAEAIQCDGKLSELAINIIDKEGKSASWTYNAFNGTLMENDISDNFSDKIKENILAKVYSSMNIASEMAGKPFAISEKHCDNLFDKEMQPLLDGTRDTAKLNINNLHVEIHKTENGFKCIYNKNEDSKMPHFETDIPNQSHLNKENFQEFLNGTIRKMYVDDFYKSQKHIQFIDFLSQKEQFVRFKNMTIDYDSVKKDGDIISFQANIHDLNSSVTVQYGINTKNLSVDAVSITEDDALLTDRTQREIGESADTVEKAFKSFMTKNLTTEYLLPDKTYFEAMMQKALDKTDEGQASKGNLYGLQLNIDKTGDYPKVNVEYETQDGKGYLNYNCYTGILKPENISEIYSKIHNTIDFQCRSFEAKENALLQAKEAELREQEQNNEFDVDAFFDEEGIEMSLEQAKESDRIDEMLSNEYDIRDDER